MSKFGPGEGSPGGKLKVLGSDGITEIDVDYDTSVAGLAEVDNQEE